MFTNTVALSIDAPVDAVFRFMTDSSRWTEWMKDVQAVHSNGDLAVGSTVQMDYTEGVSTSLQVTVLEPPRRYAYEVQGDDMSIKGVMDFASQGAGTALSYTEEVELTSFFTRMMQPFVAKSVKKALATDFAAAKEIVEAES